MKQILISRRAFLAATTATGMIALTGCGLGESDLPLPGAGEDAARGLVAYRLSTKGKRASRAAKRHAANKLFATSAAADANRAHPGDKSAIVQVDVSQAAWDRYFGQGNEVFDLRCTELGAKFAKKLAANPAPLPVPVYAAADGVITATPTAQIARALQQEWGIALPSGRPIDLVWIVLPAITTLGQYTVELTGPCPDPVPF
ncbi:MAG: hypothetical protein P1V36_06475, partial [Planctomycetota bacterium]|nr:hypothetical protein [Planctomycetota bacterium]